MNFQNRQKSSNPGQNPQQASLYDKLENIYNLDAHQNKQQAKNNKHLYSKIIEQNEQRRQQKRCLQKQVNRIQNEQIDIFWKNRENQLRQRQRKKKQMIEQSRNANNNMYAQKVLSKSMVMPSSYELAHNNHYEDHMNYEMKKNQQKQLKQRFLQQGQAINDYKHYQQCMEKQKMIESERKKIAESQELEQKRLHQLDKWRKKHLESHNKEAFEIWDRARRSRANQQDALQNYIVFQGARQLNARVSRMKNQVLDRQQAKKEHFIRQLHSQLEHNQYRTENDTKNQREYERRVIDQKNQLLSEREKYIRESKNQQNKQHLDVLKSQIKPRSVLPEKEQVQFPGLGSPVHIGKTVADDRRRQLQWLEKNLYRQLSH